MVVYPTGSPGPGNHIWQQAFLIRNAEGLEFFFVPKFLKTTILPNFEKGTWPVPVTGQVERPLEGSQQTIKVLCDSEPDQL